jgi:3-deoxy-D-manno-octulosonic-acid transferase
MLRLLYTALLCLALPFTPLRLWWRGRREPGYRAHVGERYGFFGSARPDPRPCLWIHAVSLGETRAAQPLASALMALLPDHRLLVTHMTATGRAAGEALFPEASIAFLPYDLPWAMRRFLAHYKPRSLILMETEVWPNLIAECHRAHLPVVLANARLSARSARRYGWVGSLARETFGAIDLVTAQSAADAERLRQLGARSVEVTGNLKFDTPAAADADALAGRFRSQYGRRPVLLLASTREGEEALILDALDRQPLPASTLVVIVPRHPQRFEAVAALIRSHGHALERRSAAGDVPPDTRFVLGDSLGEMSAYYRACDLAFVGGSLLPLGGQNLIEACAAGAPVLVGPSSFNFAQAVADAIAAGAALQVRDAAALIETASGLLVDRNRLDAMGGAGQRFTAMHRGAAARTAALIERALRQA